MLPGKVNTLSFLNLQSEYLSERSKFESRRPDRASNKKEVKKLRFTGDNGDSVGEDQEWIRSQDALLKKSKIYDTLKETGNLAFAGLKSSDLALDITKKSFNSPTEQRDFVERLLEVKQQEIIDEFGRSRTVVNEADRSHISTADERMVGLGFYKFSSCPSLRTHQLMQLQKLRKSTISEREEYSSLQSRRISYRDARLLAALKRKEKLSTY